MTRFHQVGRRGAWYANRGDSGNAQYAHDLGEVYAEVLVTR